MSANDFINTFLAICGGISIIGGAFAVIWKVVAPTVNLNNRVKVLEEKAQSYHKAINSIKDAQSIMCQALMALIDSRLGDNEENLKKTKDEIIKYLSESK